jgi:hypothetical protein
MSMAFLSPSADHQALYFDPFSCWTARIAKYGILDRKLQLSSAKSLTNLQLRWAVAVEVVKQALIVGLEIIGTSCAALPRLARVALESRILQPSYSCRPGTPPFFSGFVLLVAFLASLECQRALQSFILANTESVRSCVLSIKSSNALSARQSFMTTLRNHGAARCPRLGQQLRL